MGHVRSLIVAVALVGFTASALIAQVPTTYGELGVPRGGVRLKNIEESLPPVADGDTRFARAYRFNTTSEMMFGVFKAVLGGTRDLDVAQDSATLEPGEATPVGYRLEFHLFEDMCRDSGAAASDATAPCKVLLRGVDKRKAFARSGRIPYQGSQDEVWVERGTFTWIIRNADGTWVHWELVVSDDGLAKDWKHHEPYSRIVVQQITHRKPGPRPAATAQPAAQAPAAAQEPEGALGSPAQAPAAAQEPEGALGGSRPPTEASPPAQDTVPDLQPAPKDSTPSP